MPNRFTAVPNQPVPSPSRVQLWLLPLADIFMVLMISRPSTGSLRNAWVTPATLWLSLVTGVLLIAASIALAFNGTSAIALRTLGVVILMALAIGSLSVTFVAFDQRRLLRRN